MRNQGYNQKILSVEEVGRSAARLERSIAVAQAGNAPVKAVLAALTMIEEVEGLSRETLRGSVWGRPMADKLLAWNSGDPSGLGWSTAFTRAMPYSTLLRAGKPNP